jgi:SAM-dependent methyltransferase
MSLLTPYLLHCVPTAHREHFQRVAHRIRHPVWMGTLRRMAPVSRCGWQRGTPIDRFYIESFLAEHTSDIGGHVLEVKDSNYTQLFGSGVTHFDVLDINPKNPKATLIADLTAADKIPEGQFDCFILTQTLQYILDPHLAVAHAKRILKPGGVLLATVPSVMRKDDSAVDFWRFTAAACEQLFTRCFGPGNVTVEPRGNLVSTVAFLSGMAKEELRKSELEYNDDSYPVVVCVRAVKAPEKPSGRP